MIRCMAIDDEPLALQQIATYINKVPFLELVAQCQSALEARQFLEQDTVDAIFCDINMPDLNGMDFVKSLTTPPLIVFTTAYAEYAVEGFKVNAVDYLLKPFGLQDFQRAAQRLQDRFGDQDRISQGWGSHMQKRARTIQYTTQLPARDFDRWTRIARIIQTLCRPPYALNKPAMLELKIVVRIPERFADIV